MSRNRLSGPFLSRISAYPRRLLHGAQLRGDCEYSVVQHRHGARSSDQMSIPVKVEKGARSLSAAQFNETEGIAP
jgi:hypothetical protein